MTFSFLHKRGHNSSLKDARASYATWSEAESKLLEKDKVVQKQKEDDDNEKKRKRKELKSKMNIIKTKHSKEHSIRTKLTEENGKLKLENNDSGFNSGGENNCKVD